MKAILPALLLLVAAQGFAATDDKLVSISLERTTGYRSGASYVVTILANGEVTFEGRTFVKKEGIFKKKIAQSKLAPLFKKLNEIHFWQLEESYRGKVRPDDISSAPTDLPTEYVTVESTTKSKCVEDYWEAPVGLHELEDLIDSVAGTSEWVGNPNEIEVRPYVPKQNQGANRTDR